ncbi:unnamed protein product [Absidia cylindrospora]
MKKQYTALIFLLSSIYILFNEPILAATPSVSPQAAASPTLTASPTYTIGILFPNASEVRSTDPALNNMILTSELSIKLAEQHIQAMNYLPVARLHGQQLDSLKMVSMQ